MAGKFQFSLKEYQEAAVKYRADLLMLPIIGISPTTSTTTLTPATCSCMTTITTTATFSATIKTVPITTKGSPLRRLFLLYKAHFTPDNFIDFIINIFYLRVVFDCLELQFR